MKYQFNETTKFVLQAVGSDANGADIFDDAGNGINPNALYFLNANGHVVSYKYKIENGAVVNVPTQKYIYICNADNKVVGYIGQSFWKTVPEANELWLNNQEWTLDHLIGAGFGLYRKLTSTTWETV